MAGPRTYKQYKNGILHYAWYDSIYNVRYHVLIGDKLEDCQKKYEKINSQCPWPENHTYAFMGWSLEDNGFLNIQLVFHKVLTAGTIVHECVHAMNRNFIHHGISLDLYNDEPQAYYLEHLVDKVSQIYILYDHFRTKDELKALKLP